VNGCDQSHRVQMNLSLNFVVTFIQKIGKIEKICKSKTIYENKEKDDTSTKTSSLSKL